MALSGLNSIPYEVNSGLILITTEYVEIHMLDGRSVDELINRRLNSKNCAMFCAQGSLLAASSFCCTANLRFINVCSNNNNVES